MKCQQCEDRIQQLLDERVDPRNDVHIRQHVESCSTCRLMLGLYACLDQPAAVKDCERASVHAPRRPVLFEFDGGRHQQSPIRTGLKSPRTRQLVLSIALVMLAMVGAAIFSPIQPNRTGITARHSSTPTTVLPSRDISDAVVRQTASSSNYLFSNWIPTRFPNMSDVQFNSWSNVDLVSLVPKEPVDTVRGFPAAFESVAPYCRYSSEIPVVGQWANGISYTLNLLRARFMIGSPVAPLPDDGFGAFHDLQWSQTC